MPSSEQKRNMPDVWRTVKRLMCVPVSAAERDELQRHGNGEHYRTNSQSRQRVRHATGSGTRTNQMRHEKSSDDKEICKLKARSKIQEGKIERLEGKMAEQSQLMQETLAKFTSVERATNQQIAQETQVLGRLEEKVAKLDRDLRERTTELYGMLDRKDAVNMNRIQGPEANAPELSQDPQDNIAKPTGVESGQNSPMKKSTMKPLSSKGTAGKRDQEIRDSSATYRKPRHNTEGKGTNKPLPQVPTGGTDGISVAEVAELVRILNADLEQTSCRIEDLLSRRLPMGLEVASNELREYLGLWLCRDLERRSREAGIVPDPLMTQIVLQTGLVNACSRIINGWTASDIGQSVADTSRAQARTSKSNNQDINEKYLTSILRELINAVGGSLQSDCQLLSLYQEDVKGIVSKAVALHRIINEEVIPLKLVTYTIAYGTEFDSSRMRDTEWDGGETGSTPHDRVICTTEMGLQCVEPGKSRQEYDVTMKAKVVLAGTLDAQGS